MRTDPSPKWLVTALKRAIERKMPVSITYQKLDGSVTVRTVEPYEMAVSKAGDAILRALDRQSHEPRTFRLAQITKITIHARGHWLLEH